jgi:hypothetical protein
MAKIVYFVIAVDLEAKTIEIDDETFMARFDKSEQVFDEATGEWLEDEENFYDEAVAILNSKKIGE